MAGRQDKILLAVVVLALIGLVGFVSISGDEPVELGPELRDEQAGEADAAELDAYRRDPFGETARESAPQTAESDRSDPRGDGLRGSRGVDLQIMSRETGLPLPRAMLFFMTEFDAPALEWQWHREELLIRRGRRLRSDDRGMVHIEPFQGPAFVLCRHEGQYGERLFNSYHELLTGDARLFVDRDRSVALQVVDEEGRGLAGVPVALWREDSKDDDESAAERVLIWTGVTRGPEGLAFARHSLGLDARGLPTDPDTRKVPIVAELQRGRVRATFYFPPVIPQTREDRSAPDGGIEAASGLVRRLLDETAEVILGPEGPGVRPLVLPATGSVKLRLFKDDAAPFEEDCAVWIGPWAGSQDPRAAAKGLTPDCDPDPGSISDGSLPFLAEKGVVFLPRVGLNTIFDVTIMPLGGQRDPVQIAVAGPTRAKEIKVVDVPMGPERAVLSFRVEDEGGRALVETPIDVELGIPGSTRLSPEAVKRGRITTDAEGRIAFRVPVEFSRYERMELRLTGPKSKPAEPAPYTAVLLETPEPAGFLDAGSLRLAGRGLVCRGRVVDRRGRGLGEVEISIVRRPFGDEIERAASDERLVAWTQPGSVERVMAEIRTSSQGWFTYGGYRPAGSWLLRLRKTIDGVPHGVDLPFEPGIANLEIRLDPLPASD